MNSLQKFFYSRTFLRETKYGKITESENERLEFDILQGLGDEIPGTGGLKQIRCGLGGHFGKTEGWQVVFADYPQYSIVFMLVSFPDKHKKHLSRSEIKELKEIKKKLDHMVRLKYGKREKN